MRNDLILGEDGDAIHPIPRRRFILGMGVAAAAAAFLAACGGDEDSQETDEDVASTPTEDGTPESTASASPTSTQSSTGSTSPTGFPTTVPHKYGELTLEGFPKRVVSVGYRDHEHLLAFGVKPVAVRDWFGPVVEYATFPWAEEALGDAQPVVLSAGELDFEQIAALEPDLIVGLYSGMTPEVYDTLSQIAPTLPQSGDFPDYGMPWEEEVRMLGAALGKAEDAEAMVAMVDQKIVEARAAHPEFEGKTIVVGQLDAPGTYYVAGASDFRVRFFTSLGFVLAEEVATTVGDEPNLAISEEQLHLLDQDVLAWLVGATWEGEGAALDALDASSIYGSLAVVQDERDLFIREPADALAWSSALSLPYAVDGVVPLLAEAVAKLEA